MRYSEALAFLDGLVNYEKLAKPRDQFKLDDIRRLLGLAGNPQDRLKRVVLVAGTKGKGSTCYLIESALRACGLRTGLFVSPHVLDVRERIQLNGRLITPEAFARLVERFAPLVRRQPVSYFELTAALALEAFRRARVDCAVVEVGLGGRLDATNLTNPDISVITLIGLDHIKVLGGTPSKIAREKAGIIRPKRPAVIGRQAYPEALETLLKEAGRVGAMPVEAVSAVSVDRVRQGAWGVRFGWRGSLGSGTVALPLWGGHQVENCRTALAVLGLLARTDPRITAARVRRGLASVRIPARCEVVARSPLVVVDSCHNPESGAALAEAIRCHIGRKVTLVYGSLRGKLVGPTVRPLAPWVGRAVLVAPSSPRAMPLPRLKSTFTRLGIPHDSAPDAASALSLARRIADKGPVVVAGSFYLAGEALAALGRRPG